MTNSRYILISMVKILAVILLVLLLFIIGTMIGYGLIGGGSPFKVFQPSLWLHIFDFFS
ncbi:MULTISPECIES: DNA-directed RNA polymerase subunit beta [unclassified Enterococcus]|uniref:DNA-directed RNA polymerase subunit beta n=1 Tax=unclassified Enterococcus TaxID=2608891 RepID=UPI001A9358DF|nr:MULTISPECIES: DNA-directed RNA polymerase subunit beta [unclassified Enterococcus]MBO0460706.1 DNA-directed RNA polymerase subunit beta [Enterococcus sp. DIV1298c]MBO1298871.1 DNA-directed RNA polymerase subunit beta [Enterococcus sp. DIV1271a]